MNASDFLATLTRNEEILLVSTIEYSPTSPLAYEPKYYSFRDSDGNVLGGFGKRDGASVIADLAKKIKNSEVDGLTYVSDYYGCGSGIMVSNYFAMHIL